jgi:iron complex outermembrane receptor protein
VNGVINIITTSPRDAQGGSVVAGAGGDMLGYGSASYSGRMGSHGFYHAYAGYQVHDALQGPPGNNEGEWIHRTGGFRMEWDLSGSDSLTVEGQGYTGNQNDVLSYLSPFRYNPGPLQRQPMFYSGGNVVGEWRHSVSERSDITVRAYYERYAENDADVDKTLDVIDVEMHDHFVFSPRHELVWGAGYRSSAHESVQGLPIVFNPISTKLYSGFLQDEFSLIPNKLHLIAGTQIEHNTYTGPEVQPSLRLLWQPSKKYSTWAGVSRAVRTPSAVERGGTYTFLDYDFGRPFPLVAHGTPTLKSETLLGYELGQRVDWKNRVSLDLSTFYNFYNNLSTQSPTNFYIDPRGFVVMPALYTNIGEARTYGGEASLNVAATNRWKLSAGYSWLRILPKDYNQRLGVTEINGPTDAQHQAQLQSNLDLTRTLQLDGSLYYNGSIPAFAIPSHWRADVRLGWRPLHGIELSVAGQDLLSSRHPEYLFEVFGRTLEVSRGVTGNVRWTF